MKTCEKTSKEEILPLLIQANLTLDGDFNDAISFGEYSQSVILLVLTVVSLVGNFIVVIVIGRVQGLSSGTKSCIRSLCTGNILISLLLPFYAIKAVIPHIFTSHHYVCWAWFASVIFQSSFYTGKTLLTLLVHYFTIGCPTCYKIQGWHVYFSCFAVYFISAAIAFLPTFCFEMFFSCESCEFTSMWTGTYLLGYSCTCVTAAVVVLVISTYLYHYVKGHCLASVSELVECVQ